MRTSLPIDSHLARIVESLRPRPSLVLSAAPGAGKTTRLPPELLKITQKDVWVLEPRRIAAIAASQRIAEENGWELGREVGYQVRFENRSSRATRLLFLTEALLLRKLLRDPDLRNVGCVVLDEFHERSLHVDLALGALRELQELSRPDLKLVVMSATLDADPLSRFLGGAPVVDVPGKLFPLELRFDEKTMLLRTGPEFTERMRRLVLKAFTESADGDILCFLPGRGEIEWLRQALGSWADSRNVAVLPLHGQLNLQAQKAALEPQRGRRRVILATNVAESSLTVEGVRAVVDSGLARISQLHPRTGFASLDLTRISKASATQRAGRAARLGPGTAYRAWIPYDELSMKEFEPAEVQRSDLSESLLLLAALGVSRPESFSWFEAPPARSLEQARAFLLSLGALTTEGALTPLGSALRDFPLHPRLAKLLLAGRERGLAAFACDLAALLGESGARVPASHHEGENDLWLRWREWKHSPHHPKSRALDRTASQLRGLLQNSGPEPAGTADAEKELPALLLEIYADRLCRRRRPHEPQARMAGGRGVRLHPDSSVKTSEYFLALELAEGRDAAETLVFQAVGIPDSLVAGKLLPQARLASRLEWDEEKSRFFVAEAEEWNGLPVGREHRRPAGPDEIGGQLAGLLFERWERLLAANEGLAAWLARLRFLHRTGGQWPLLTDSQRREGLDLACFGETSFTAVAEKDLVPFFEGLLSAGHREALARECPSHWVVPSGSRMRIVYSDEQGPQVEVRLQELFGLAAQPKLAGQPLTLVLLAPNFRPVQVTRDLASFWRSGYLEVRKELRARYPKHSWPEDPLSAAPQAKGRPRSS